MRRLLGAALALGILATGCTKVSQTPQAGERVNSFTIPHTLRIADGTDITTLNPHLGQFTPILFMSRMTMAWLVKWDDKNQPYGELATEVPTTKNGGVSKDGLTITYHLRKGVKWSDGAPFDADDVVFSTNVVLNPKTNEVGRLGWDQITKVDEPDKYTVVYHLKKPYSPFVETFFSTVGANPCVLPKHLLYKLPNINNAAYNSLPVGIGPFKYERWDRQQQVVMVANPLYFRGRPKLDKIIYKIVPDRNTLLTLFQAKELDLWPLVTGNYVARLKELQPYTVFTQPGYYWQHIDFNETNPALADVVVRQALFVAIDRPALIEKISHGDATLSDSPTPIKAPYAVSLPITPFDLAKANALLEKDGWKIGSDGVRAKNGKRLSFSFAMYTGAPDMDNAIELIRANWKLIGVEINVRHYPREVFFSPIEVGGVVYDPKKWDITTFAWGNEAIGDYSAPYAGFSIPPNGQDDTHWQNAKADAAMRALFGHYDQEERNKDVAIVIGALHDAYAAPVLYIRPDIFAYNKDLKNFAPNNVTPFDDMMNVDI